MQKKKNIAKKDYLITAREDVMQMVLCKNNKEKRPCKTSHKNAMCKTMPCKHTLYKVLCNSAMLKHLAKKPWCKGTGGSTQHLVACTYPCTQRAEADGRGQAPEGDERVDVSRHLLRVEWLPQHPSTRWLPLARLLLGVRQEVAELEGAAEQEVQDLHLVGCKEEGGCRGQG